MASNSYAPFDDDLAVSLYSKMWRSCDLPSLIRQFMNSSSAHDDISVIEIRALAYLVIVLGNSSIWPIDDLDGDLRLVVEKLDRCISIEPNPEFRFLMRKEKLCYSTS